MQFDIVISSCKKDQFVLQKARSMSDNYKRYYKICIVM